MCLTNCKSQKTFNVCHITLLQHFQMVTSCNLTLTAARSWPKHYTYLTHFRRLRSIFANLWFAACISPVSAADNMQEETVLKLT